MAEKELTIYCHCAGYDLAPKDVKSSVLNALRAGGGHVIEVADLCRLSADKDAKLLDWATAQRIRIFACYERAIRWLFSAAGAPLPDSGVEYHNMRAEDAEELVSAAHDRSTFNVQRSTTSDTIRSTQYEQRTTNPWVPWFPVIDYDRCTNCGQCLNFCLFGVYGRGEDGRVEVAAPANCKTHCPACARVCPRAAIIFPKHADSPINGDRIDEQALAAHKEKARLEVLLKGDIRQRLRNRGAAGRRFSTQPGEPVDYLEQLKKDLAIPDEVLASLSGDEIAAIRGRARPGAHDKD